MERAAQLYVTFTTALKPHKFWGTEAFWYCWIVKLSGVEQFLQGFAFCKIIFQLIQTLPPHLIPKLQLHAAIWNQKQGLHLLPTQNCQF